MTYDFSVTPSYREFQQACRAFKPSELIPAPARVSSALGRAAVLEHGLEGVPVQGAGRCRARVAGPRERVPERSSRRPGAAAAHVRQFQTAGDVPRESELGPELFVRLMTRFTYEQFPWQEPMFGEVARSHAWLLGGLARVPTEVITEDALAVVLGGMSLREAIGAAHDHASGVPP